MIPADMQSLAQKVITGFAAAQKKIVTAESCTGGLIAAALTSVSGSSDVLERGFVSYSNDAKFEVLGVMPEVLAEFGAVSAEVAEAMAVGALEFSRADVAVSITGIAGPTGGTPSKPVGLVFIGIATRDGVIFHIQNNFTGNRDSVRAQAVREALTMLATHISQSSELDR